MGVFMRINICIELTMLEKIQLKQDENQIQDHFYVYL